VVARNRQDSTHGGLAVIAVPGVHGSQINVGVKSNSFQLLCTLSIVLVVYRHGSVPVSSVFYENLSETIEQPVGCNETTSSEISM